MRDAASNSQKYELLFGKGAWESQADLSPRAHRELDRLIDEFSEEPPDRSHDRVEEISGLGVLLYRHPDPPLEVTYRINLDRRVITFINFAVREMVGSLVVISYSHADEKWRDVLKKFLKPFERKKLIRIWDDTAIEEGDRWRMEIARFFGSAKVAVLLVSPDFLASDFIAEEELPLLLKRRETHGVRLLWIAVRPSNYETLDLREDQALNDPSRPLASLRKPDREKVFATISKKIVAAVKRASLPSER